MTAIRHWMKPLHEIFLRTPRLPYKWLLGSRYDFKLFFRPEECGGQDLNLTYVCKSEKLQVSKLLVHAESKYFYVIYLHMRYLFLRYHRTRLYSWVKSIDVLWTCPRDYRAVNQANSPCDISSLRSIAMEVVVWRMNLSRQCFVVKNLDSVIEKRKPNP